MLVHPQFDPIAVSIGPLAVRWYGLMYLVGFVCFWLLGRRRLQQTSTNPAGFTLRDLDDLLFFGAMGVVIGGRLGYVLFYKPAYYLQHPLEALAVWQGGMAFHGGFLGVAVAMWLFARTRKVHWLTVTDFIAPLVPLGLAAGRLGNFINGELWGRPTDASWGMVFPQAADGLARHPSQLYQFALEGITLFVVLWLFSSRPRPMGMVSGLFLLGYGVCRFVVEFAREPDNFLGLLALSLSMGQWLSLPMIVAGLALMVWSKRRAT